MLLDLVPTHPGQVFKQSCASLLLSNYCVISLEEEVTMFQERNKPRLSNCGLKIMLVVCQFCRSNLCM